MIITIPCLNCGGTFVLDYNRTLDFFVEKVTEASFSEIVDFPVTLIFKCNSCFREKEFSLEEFLIFIKDEIIHRTLQIKKHKYISENILPADFKDSKLIYCGQCNGVKDGWCPQTFYNRCLIRKEDYGL